MPARDGTCAVRTYFMDMTAGARVSVLFVESRNSVVAW